MAYDKKYPGINEEILAFDKGQEDRTEKTFKNVVGTDYPSLKVKHIYSNVETTTDSGGYCGLNIPYNNKSIVVTQLVKVADSTITASYNLTTFPSPPIYRHTLWKGGQTVPNTKIITNILVFEWE